MKMEVGDLVRCTCAARKKSKYNNLAVVVGFDGDGDLYLRYINPSKGKPHNENDYKNSWELVNENR